MCPRCARACVLFVKQILHHVTAAGLWFRYWTYRTCLPRPPTLAPLIFRPKARFDGCSRSSWHVGLPVARRGHLCMCALKFERKQEAFFQWLFSIRARRNGGRQLSVSHRPNYSSVRKTHRRSHLLSLPRSLLFLSAAAGIGYSMFSHGTLNRALEMKSPPPLNQASENMRGDAATQALGVTRANCGSAVGSLWLAVWSIYQCENWLLFLSLPSCSLFRGESYTRAFTLVAPW